MSVSAPTALASYSSSGTATSHPTTVTASAAAGAYVVVVANVSNTTDAMTMTDSQSNTWTAAPSGPFATSAAGNTARMQIWTSLLTTGLTSGVDTLTLGATPTNVRANIIAFTLTGLNTGSPIRQAASANNDGGTVNAAWTAPSATASSGDLILLFGVIGGATGAFSSPPSGFTDYLKVADTRALDVLYKQSAGETVAASGTLSVSSNPWIGASMVMQVSAQSATVVFPQSVTIHS